MSLFRFARRRRRGRRMVRALMWAKDEVGGGIKMDGGNDKDRCGLAMCREL
jgi:hypothetical protein